MKEDFLSSLALPLFTVVAQDLFKLSHEKSWIFPILKLIRHTSNNLQCLEGQIQVEKPTHAVATDQNFHPD